MKYRIELQGREASVSVRPLPDGQFAVAIDDGAERVVHAHVLGTAEWLLRDEGGSRKVAVHVRGDALTAQVRGRGVSGRVEDPRSVAHHAGDTASAGTIRSPMPGAVARVLVRVGDAVTKGQVLVVVEAMKMENEFRSPCDGVVGELGAVAGTAIEAGALLVTVTPGGAA
jgi:biotin carboxyl carrier protein